MSNFYKKLDKDLRSNPDDASKTFKETWRFFLMVNFYI